MRELLKRWLPQLLETRPEQTASVALVACVAFSLVSIAASQIMLAVSIGALLWAVRTEGLRFGWRPVFLPLLLFFIWTIAAALASSDVWLGLGIVKKFYLFLLIPMVPRLLAGEGRIRRSFEPIIGMGLFAAAVGMIQFAENPHRDLLHRISGFMSHWMTYSGLLMLVLVMLVAYGFCRGWRKNLWVIAAVLVLAIPISLSQTRNAMIGAVAGVIALLLLLGRVRAIAGLLVMVAAVYFAAPDSFRQRVRSGWDPSDPNTRNRIELFGTSARLIRNNPVFGVGPKNVQVEALRYRGSHEFPDWLYQHMHNNFLQIAAERGLPGLALWLWLMARFALDAWGVFRRSPGPDAKLASSAALGCWVALLVSGMVEYNFGDSEVLTLFLFVQSAPGAFAADTGRQSAAAASQTDR
jgi:O-antigen ligase